MLLLLAGQLFIARTVIQGLGGGFASPPALRLPGLVTASEGGGEGADAVLQLANVTLVRRAC